MMCQTHLDKAYGSQTTKDDNEPMLLERIILYNKKVNTDKHSIAEGQI